MYMRAKLLPSCLTLCNSVNYSPPGSFVHGIHQATILVWAAMPQGIFPTEGSKPCLMSPVFPGMLLTTSTTWEAQNVDCYAMLC